MVAPYSKDVFRTSESGNLTLDWTKLSPMGNWSKPSETDTEGVIGWCDKTRITLKLIAASDGESLDVDSLEQLFFNLSNPAEDEDPDAWTSPFLKGPMYRAIVDQSSVEFTYLMMAYIQTAMYARETYAHTNWGDTMSQPEIYVWLLFRRLVQDLQDYLESTSADAAANLGAKRALVPMTPEVMSRAATPSE